MKPALLILASAFAGLIAAAVLYLAPAAKIRAERNRIQAHLMEFRLFFDEPSLVWNAQVQLLRANARLLTLLLPALLILTPWMYYICLQLEPLYAYRDPAPGEPIVLIAQLRSTTPLEIPANLTGAVVETPVLRLAACHQLVWRIHVSPPTALTLQIGSRILYKSLDARAVFYPSGDVTCVQLHYPKTHQHAWIAWFCVLSTAFCYIFVNKFFQTR